MVRGRWSPHTSQATLAGVGVVVTGEGAECGRDGDHEFLALASCRVTAQQTDSHKKWQECHSQLFVGGPFVPHVADLVEPEVDVGDSKDLIGLLDRLLRKPGLQEPCQVRTFDDVDTLDVYSGSHPTNLSVRLPWNQTEGCRHLSDHLASTRNYVNNKLKLV